MYEVFDLIAQGGVGAGPGGTPGTGLFGLDWPEVVATVLGGVGTAWAAWWAYQKNKLTSKETQQFKFYEQLLAECNTLRIECTELRKAVGAQAIEVQALKDRLAFFEDNKLASQARKMLQKAADSLPIPFWIHSVGENKWYLNSAYCELFNIERLGFWVPINIFARYDPSDALSYIAHDLQVIEAGVAIKFKERIRKDVTDPNCEDYVYGKFRKVPVEIDDVKYVIGMMIGKLSLEDAQQVKRKYEGTK